MKRGKIIKWIVVIYVAFFMLQFVITMFAGLRMSSNQKVTLYSDIEIGTIVATNIGQTYEGYVAGEGYTLYEVKTELTNTVVGAYDAYSAFTYYADGAFSNGFKGGVYTESADINDMSKCMLVYTNCPEYDSNFGYDIASVIPGGCTIVRRDIVEVPEGATHVGIETIYFGGEERIITLD